MISVNQTNEEKRQLALYDIGLLDTGADEHFDRLTRIAVKLFDVPMALVTLIDAERQYFKSVCGVELQPTNKTVSFCNWIVNTSLPMIIEDTLLNPNFSKNPFVTGYPFIRFYAGYPVRLPNGEIAGAICVLDISPRSFSPEQMSLLMDLAGIVEDEFKLLQLATKDSLTELFNRRSYTLFLEETCRKAQLKKGVFSVIVIDLDEFKFINDTFGHHEGNRALKAFASILEEVTAGNHIIARLGGDEFSILLTDCSEADALAVVEKLALAVHTFNQSAALSGRLSFSAGAAEFNAEKHKVPSDIMKEADSKMYAMKKGGIP